MTYTNEEQSRELIQCGIDENTADLRLRAIVRDELGRNVQNPKYELVTDNKTTRSYICGISKIKVIPSWSYEKLLSLLVKNFPITIDKVDIKNLVDLYKKMMTKQ